MYRALFVYYFQSPEKEIVKKQFKGKYVSNIVKRAYYIYIIILLYYV